MHSYLHQRRKRTLELVTFAMLGTILVVSRTITMVMLPPNVHILAPIMAASTIVYRWKALVPIYLFVVLDGLLNQGFTVWWYSWLYVWLPLWAMFMIAGKIKMPVIAQVIVYGVLCALHGFSFGTLLAPYNALVFGFGLEWQGMVAWIVRGLPFDAIHSIGNLVAGTILTVPLAMALKEIKKRQV